MKKQRILLLIMLLIIGLFATAQTPQQIDFQGMARDAIGEPIINQNINVRMSILDGPAGSAVYTEEQSLQTDAYGVFVMQIGLYTSLSAVDWGAGSYYLNIEMAVGGGSYIDMGTTQLMSVPYALWAENVANVDDDDPDPTNEFQTLSISGNDLSISDGNMVTLPTSGSSLWSQNGDDIYYLDGNVGIGTDIPNYGANPADSKVLTVNAATTGGADEHPAVLEFRGSDADDGGVLGKMEFFNWANGVDYDLAKIEVTRSDPTNQAYSTLNFFTRKGSPSTYTSKMTIDHDGNTGIGENEPLVKLQVVQDNSAGANGTDLGCLYSPSQNLSPAIAGFSDNSTSDINYGLMGHASSTTSPFNMGVFGEGADGTSNNYGIYGAGMGTAGSNYSIAIYGDDEGSASNNYAGYFIGDVHVSGNLSKSAGTFKIDHPMDPANKYLIHSFVESPDMMNIYNGNIITDAQGLATVELPDYFEAENINFRYQLTVIGEFAQAIVKDKISDNQFVIMTDKSNIEVSWQVTGVRNDVYAQEHRVIPEVNKEGVEKGKYLHPELFGKSKTEGMPVGISEK